MRRLRWLLLSPHGWGYRQTCRYSSEATLEHGSDPWETVVDTAILGYLGRSQETVRTDSVVEVYDNDVVVAGLDQAAAVVVWVRILVEASALDEKVDGERVAWWCVCRRVNVHEETVLRRDLGGCSSGSKAIGTKLVEQHEFCGKKNTVKLTVSATIVVLCLSGSWGAANLKSPTGGAAYLTPNHCVTPFSRETPWYFEYPTSTKGSTAPTTATLNNPDSKDDFMIAKTRGNRKKEKWERGRRSYRTEEIIGRWDPSFILTTHYCTYLRTCRASRRKEFGVDHGMERWGEYHRHDSRGARNQEKRSMYQNEISA
jgi:hypothetical protein